MNSKHVSFGILSVAIILQITHPATAAEVAPSSSPRFLVDGSDATVSLVSATKDEPASETKDEPASETKDEPASELSVEPNPAPGPCGNCNSPCCDDLNCCKLCPCVYGFTEALFMQRTHGDPVRDILIDGNTGQTVLSSSDLNFNYADGVRAVLGFCFDGMPLELGYFGLFDSNASTTVVAAPGEFLTFPGDLGPAFNVFSPADRVHVDYQSEIESGEVNFHCCCCTCGVCGECPQSVEWLAGFRYLSLREKLNIAGERSVNTAPETGYYDVQTQNNLCGGQLGARWRCCHGRFNCEATCKAGVFGNSAREDQNAEDFPNFALRPPVAANGENVAFMGELNLTGIYQLNNVWGIRAGYNVMLIEGVALAPDQLDFTFTSTSGSQLHNNGGMFLQGANVGLEARW